MEQEPPRIEFPCAYPIKVLASSSEDLLEVVLDVFERHAAGFERSTVTSRPSSKGTFTALTVTIIATGPDQLEALHLDLRATGCVKMVIGWPPRCCNGNSAWLITSPLCRP